MGKQNNNDYGAGGDDDVDWVLELKSAWLNETFCPEILEYKSEAVEVLKNYVEQKQMELSSGVDDVKEAFRANIYQLEVDRVQYLLKSYLRERLKKIEKYAQYILSTKEMKKRLSPQELKFAEAYLALEQRHFQTSLLDHLPEGFKEPGPVMKPQLGAYVYCRVKENVGNIQISDDG
eukprot:GEZU01022538.1.p1 GENE.GEZU01022538.1~~GEZU01022538.1.p1  ORF type:complete len:177 (+),score=30.54 GEZU01022538.1:128-658(+)